MEAIIEHDIIDLYTLIADLSLEDAVAHFVTLCWDAGEMVGVDEVEEYILEILDLDEPEDADAWAAERGAQLVLKAL